MSDAVPNVTKEAVVLVVDDSPLVCEALTELLRAEGYATLTAGDAREALLVCERVQGVDVAVVDRFLPDGDGIELLRSLKERSPEMEVIVLTGGGDLQSAVAALRGGAFDYCDKASSLDGVIEAVRRALEQRYARAALARASQVIFSVTDRADLPERIVQAATAALDADDATLMLPAVDGQLYIAFSNGLSLEVQRAERVPIGERVAGRVARDRRPALLRDELKHDDRFAHMQPSRRVRSSIVYPLHSGEKLVGVLCLNRTRADKPFNTSDLERVTVLAAQVTLALEVQALLRQLSAAEKFSALGQLMGSITHEINNPISYVLTNLDYAREVMGPLRDLCELIEGGATSARVAEQLRALGGAGRVHEASVALEDTEHGAKRVREVVRDMRAVARGQEGSADVGAAVQLALRLTSADLRPGVEVEIDVPAGLVVPGSTTRLSQVFINLFNNAAFAIHHSEAKKGHLFVSAKLDGQRVSISVRDTGPGIPPEALPRLFEPFFTTKPPGSGTGLGLSLCLEIIRQSGGDMRVASEVGVGTTFTMEVPLARPSARAIAPSPDVKPKRPTVLCVDDEEAVCRSYRRALGQLYDVTTTSSASQAWELLSSRRDFDLVVCDLIMPEMTGMELFGRVTRDAPELVPRFLFVTGSTLRPEIQAFAKTVQNRVIEKPLAIDVVKGIVNDLEARYLRS